MTRLLLGIARNKLANRVREQAADKRDYRRANAGPVEQDDLPIQQPSPSRCVEMKELLQTVRERLSPEERQLVEYRQQGMEWAEIAERVGENAVALRKRFSRTRWTASPRNWDWRE